jgi:acyl carrier protein
MPNVSIEELKRLLAENCVLKTNLDSITEETPLFGPESVGLDSLDALQMAVSIEKHYGVAITDSDTAQKALRSLGTLRQWLADQTAAKPRN